MADRRAAAIEVTIEPPRISIGTAGWGIPAAAAAHFPGAGSHLERYGGQLSAVEVNSSFHREHRKSTYQRWAASVPAGFRFSVKIPKTISHTARLENAEALIEAFVEQVAGLGEHLAVVLLQLPPSLAYDERVVVPFLATLRRQLPALVGIACEPRHASWFVATADACLVEHRVARVAADPVLVTGGDRSGGWPGLRYHRLHGAPRVYYSPYAPAYLANLAATLAADAPSTDTWCIFDNTASGAAIGNALELRSWLPAATPMPAQ